MLSTVKDERCICFTLLLLTKIKRRQEHTREIDLAGFSISYCFMFYIDYRRQTVMGANGVPSWSIVQVRDAEGAEEETTGHHATGAEDTLRTIPRTHLLEPTRDRLPVQQPGSKQRRYSSGNEKVTNPNYLSLSTQDISGSCSSSRTQSASSDSDLEKRRKLRKFKDATLEMTLETKRLLSSVKYKLLNRRGGKETPVKQIHLMPESDTNRWACKPATANNRVNSRTSKGTQSYHHTANPHVLQDLDNEYFTQNELDGHVE